MGQLARIPEEQSWLASRTSAQTRRAYRNDVAHCMRTLHIQSIDKLRRVDHRAVMAWEQLMREEQGSQASTVRWRLAALSSLFVHLVKFGVVGKNAVWDVERPAINRREGMTLAFSHKQARSILDAPDATSLLGVRDPRKGLEARRHLHPDVIDRILRNYARSLGLDRGYSAHSMRATFITTALDHRNDDHDYSPPDAQS